MRQRASRLGGSWVRGSGRTGCTQSGTRCCMSGRSMAREYEAIEPALAAARNQSGTRCCMSGTSMAREYEAIEPALAAALAQTVQPAVEQLVSPSSRVTTWWARRSNQMRQRASRLGGSWGRGSGRTGCCMSGMSVAREYGAVDALAAARGRGNRAGSRCCMSGRSMARGYEAVGALAAARVRSNRAGTCCCMSGTSMAREYEAIEPALAAACERQVDGS